MVWCLVKLRDNFTFFTFIGIRLEAGVGKGFISLRHRVQTGSGGIQIPIQCVPWASSSGIKRPGCETDHPPPTSAEVKNA